MANHISSAQGRSGHSLNTHVKKKKKKKNINQMNFCFSAVPRCTTQFMLAVLFKDLRDSVCVCVCSRAVHPTWECVSVTEHLQGPPYFIKDDFVSHLVTSRRIKMCTALTHTHSFYTCTYWHKQDVHAHTHAHSYIYLLTKPLCNSLSMFTLVVI